MIRNAHVIGMGRLGIHLSERLESLGVKVSRYNRTAHPKAKALENWEAMNDLDAVFLAVSDSAIQDVAGRICPSLPSKACLIHHAGSVSRNILPWNPSQTAVLWPPMTFQSNETPDWQTLPMAVETVHGPLQEWARLLAPCSFSVNPEQRQHLHLGAVLLGNLTAAWVGTVQAHLKSMSLDPSILSPLVQASVEKATQGAALDTVTGPAARNDRATLTAQSNLLQSPEVQPELALLHHHLTNCILSHHGHLPFPPFQAETGQD